VKIAAGAQTKLSKEIWQFDGLPDLAILAMLRHRLAYMTDATLRGGKFARKEVNLIYVLSGF